MCGRSSQRETEAAGSKAGSGVWWKQHGSLRGSKGHSHPSHQIPVITLHSSPRAACSQLGVGLFSHVTSERTRGNGLKLYWERFTLDIRKKFLHGKVCQALEQAAQGGGGATHYAWRYLKDVALGDMFSGGLAVLGNGDFRGSLQPKQFYDCFLWHNSSHALLLPSATHSCNQILCQAKVLRRKMVLTGKTQVV